jgi:two-component system sensor histidine kinase HydH
LPGREAPAYTDGVKAWKPPRRAFTIGTAVFLALVLGLVWTMAIRENAVRRLAIEFDAYRYSTIVVEKYLEDPDSVTTGESVLGLGIYMPDGTALLREGSAPEGYSIDWPFFTNFQLLPGAGSVILVRPLGADEGFGLRQGMMRGMMPPMPGAPGPDAEGRGRASGMNHSLRQPRILWLEFSAGSWSSSSLLTLAIAALISLGMAGLYVYLVKLYKRNLDLMDREARNRELIQLGEAARTLAHEIRNPLAIIRIQTASMRKTGGEQVAAPLGVIEEEVARLGELTDRIREFLRSGEGDARPVELAAFLGDFASRYAAAGQDVPSLDVGLPPPGLRIRIDPARLSQALDNVVRNALEACPGGPAPRVSVQIKARSIEIAVDDSGPGVPPELEPRLFEPFFTTKEKGSGIGLALARKIAESSGGSLAYRRRPEGGSSFVFSFPLVQP